MAHITGGGLVDNIPRVLPRDCDAVIDTGSWKIPTIFNFIGEKGNVDRAEMFQVFNMGIGMVAIVAQADVDPCQRILQAKVIGRVERGSRKTRLIF